jgi:hypothetical protein
MSAEGWLQAAKNEEERLFVEIAKTTLYKQLEAVRAVITLYERKAEPYTAPEQHGPTMPSSRTNGQTPRHGFKKANAFSDLAEAAPEANSRPGPQ